MSPTQPTVSMPEFSPLSLVRMLWKHRLMVAVVAIVGLMVSVVVVRQLPSIYRSEALILLDSQKIPEKYVTSTVNTDVQERLASISQEILSTTRLQKIIDDFGLYRDERKKLAREEVVELMRKDITITLENGGAPSRPAAFRVGYQGRNPTLVTEVASRLSNLFVEEDLQNRERQAQGTANFIDSQLNEAKKTLDDLEAKVSKYKLAHNGDLPEQETSLNATLTRLQLELQGNQDAVNRAQQNKTVLQGTVDMAEAAAGTTHARRPSANNPFEVSTNSNPLPEGDSKYLEAQYDALSKLYQPTYPRMVALRHEIERQKLVEDSERARVENLKKQIALVDREIQQRTSERERILNSIQLYQARIEQLPVREQETAALTRDYEMSKTNYKSLLDKKLAAGMATDMEKLQQGERFTMLDPPRVPEKPISPQRPKLIGIGFVISLVLAFAIPIAIEKKKNAVLGEWELPEGVVVLGRIPYINPGSSSFAEPRKRKWAVISTVGLLGTCLAGVYLYWGMR
jgi:succinoglycan biosynthesis transport protein ExoP